MIFSVLDSLTLFLALAAARRLSTKFLDHRRTQRIQCIGRFMSFAAHIVAHERENQPAPIWQFRVTRPRADMLKGSGLCMNSHRRAGILQTILKRSVQSRDGE